MRHIVIVCWLVEHISGRSSKAVGDRENIVFGASGVAVDYAGMDVREAFGDSRLSRYSKGIFRVERTKRI